MDSDSIIFFFTSVAFFIFSVYSFLSHMRCEITGKAAGLAMIIWMILWMVSVVISIILAFFVRWWVGAACFPLFYLVYRPIFMVESEIFYPLSNTAGGAF